MCVGVLDRPPYLDSVGPLAVLGQAQVLDGALGVEELLYCLGIAVSARECPGTARRPLPGLHGNRPSHDLEIGTSVLAYSKSRTRLRWFDQQERHAAALHSSPASTSTPYWFRATGEYAVD